MELLDRTGRVVAVSNASGRASEFIHCTLEAGSYTVRVSAYGTASTSYRLGMSAESLRQTRPWTVMVYIAADDVETAALNEFLEMARAGSNSKLNIVVQLDRTGSEHSSFRSGSRRDDTRFGNWTHTRRGLVDWGDTPGWNWGTSIGEADMGNPNTLKEFVNWSMTNYSAERYALVVWGHANGFQLAFDDQSKQSLSPNDLQSALSGLPRTIDLFGTVGCLMGMTEVAYQLRNVASVFVASQELVPTTSWNFTSVFSDLSANSSMNAFQLGDRIVRHYANTYPRSIRANAPMTFSAVNLTRLRDSNPNHLASTIDRFARTMMTVATRSDLSILDSYRDRYTSNFGKLQGNVSSFPNYADLGNIFYNFAIDRRVSFAVQNAARSVMDALADAVILNYSATRGRADGLSLYFSNKGDYPETRYNASNFELLAHTQWDEFLNWVEW